MSAKINFEIKTKLLADKKNIKRILENQFPNKIRNYYSQNNKDRTISCCFSVKQTDEPEKIKDFIETYSTWKLVL